jgi:hypothetical protein
VVWIADGLWSTEIEGHGGMLWSREHGLWRMVAVVNGDWIDELRWCPKRLGAAVVSCSTRQRRVSGCVSCHGGIGPLWMHPIVVVICCCELQGFLLKKKEKAEACEDAATVGLLSWLIASYCEWFCNHRSS